MHPEDVLTKSKKGDILVRHLVDNGKFIKYNYRDPKTGKALENNKVSLVLIGKEKEHYYMIPIKGGRYLVLPVKDKKRKIWDGEKAIDI